MTTTTATIDRDDVLIRLTHHIATELRAGDDGPNDLITAAQMVAQVQLTYAEAEEALNYVHLQVAAEQQLERYEDVRAEYRWLAAEQHADNLAALCRTIVERAVVAEQYDPWAIAPVVTFKAS